MRFNKIVFIAMAAASLMMSVPVIAGAPNVPVDTENIVAGEFSLAGHSEAQSASMSPKQSTVYVIAFKDDVYNQRFVHFAVLRSGPAGITSLQMTSLVNLSVQSQFINFADRYRAHNIT